MTTEVRRTLVTMTLVKVVCFTAILSVLTQLAEGDTGCSAWPPEDTEKCTQSTKQKAMYGKMTFEPSLKKKPMTKMNVQVKWDDLQFAPYNSKNKGGVYVAYTTGLNGGPGGYFGVQLTANRGQFLFSIWDSDRWLANKVGPKPSSKLTWPLNRDRCKRNCQDCGMQHLKEWKKKGLTTGTKCSLKQPNMKVGDQFDITLEQTQKQFTINTKDYGGMPEKHGDFGEHDREITGGVWVVTARNIKTNEAMEVGKMLFEGDGRGMNRLGTFDEMLGCNECNRIYHRDTRFGPFIHDEDGKIRKPTTIDGINKAEDSTCKKYYISGSKADSSISFEGGPLTCNSIPQGIRKQKIW